MPPGSKPRQSRLLLRRASSRKSIGSNAVSECDLFLSSSGLGTLLSDLPERSAPWEAALNKALALWEKMDASETSTEETQEMTKAIWAMACVLLKANYYLQIKEPLERIHLETCDEYILHAAVGVIQKRNRSTALRSVIERLLQTHWNQLETREPMKGRYPLHVAASTPYQSDRFEILMGLLEAYPQAATEVDSHGVYPLHLACQAKYPWKHGLEKLYTSAPHVGELSCPCCPPELLAKQDCYDKSLETVYALTQEDSSLFS